MTTLPEVPSRLDEIISTTLRIQRELRADIPDGSEPYPELVLGLVELALK